MTDTPALRILIAEDEAMISLILEDYIGLLGHSITGPCATLEECHRTLGEDGAIDIAILDCNLLDGPIWPFARHLGEKGIPFLFTSGDDGEGMPADLANRPVLGKPYTMNALEKALIQLMAR
jgi:DNA-binding response OmpR family regulator